MWSRGITSLGLKPSGEGMYAPGAEQDSPDDYTARDGQHHPLRKSCRRYVFQGLGGPSVHKAWSTADSHQDSIEAPDKEGNTKRCPNRQAASQEGAATANSI